MNWEANLQNLEGSLECFGKCFVKSNVTSRGGYVSIIVVARATWQDSTTIFSPQFFLLNLHHESSTFRYYSFKMDDIGIIKLSHGRSLQKKISNTFIVSIGLKQERQGMESIRKAKFL